MSLVARSPSLEILLSGGKDSISTVGRDSHRTVTRRPVWAGVSKQNANRRCKIVARIEYGVLLGEKCSISNVGRDSHRTVSRRPVWAGVSEENANRR